MDLYACVCVCVLNTNTYIHACVHISIMHTHTYINSYMHMNIYFHTYTFVFICMHIHAQESPEDFKVGFRQGTSHLAKCFSSGFSGALTKPAQGYFTGGTLFSFCIVIYICIYTYMHYVYMYTYLHVIYTLPAVPSLLITSLYTCMCVYVSVYIIHACIIYTLTYTHMHVYKDVIRREGTAGRVYITCKYVYIYT